MGHCIGQSVIEVLLGGAEPDPFVMLPLESVSFAHQLFMH